MGNLSIWCIFVAIFATVVFAQQRQNYQYGQQTLIGQHSTGGRGSSCVCTQQYVPFCATDGREERTYSNKCEFECAQRSNPSLRIRFEGVCAKKYEHNSDSSSSWGSSSQYRPQTTTTTRKPISGGGYYGFRPQPTQSSSFAQYRPSTYPTATSGYRPQQQATYKPQYPAGSSSSSQSQYRPQYPSQSSGYRPEPPTTSRYPSYGSGSGGYRPQESRPISQYRPYPETTTTTAKPWWQSQQARTRYPPDDSSNYVGLSPRKNRDIYDDDNEDGDDYY